MGKGIAIDRLAVQPLSFSKFVEGGGVIPASSTGLFLTTGLLEEHTQGVGTIAEGRGNTRRQPIAAGCAHHQHSLGPLGLVECTGTGGLDLLEHILLAADRMRSGTDETANLGFDDHDRPHYWCGSTT